MSNIEFAIQNLTRNCNEALILAILFQEKKHGYQLALEIEEKSQNQFKFNHGTLYPILHKLEKDGLIKGTWKKEGPVRKRKYYAITTKGKNHIQNQAKEWKIFYKHFFQIVGEVEK